MRWTRGLTKGQRLTLVLLALGSMSMISLLIWNVWSTIKAGPPVPLPTPTTQTISLPTPTLTPQPTEIPTPTIIPTFDVTEAGQIAADVAEVRGFQGYWGTPLTLVDQHDLSVALYRYYVDNPPFVINSHIIWDALQLHSLEPAIQNITPTTTIDVVSQAQNAAAIYFPETEEFYFRRDWSEALDVLETQLVYGYARALPDQYGNIPGLIADAASLDRRLALTAVADGDALFTLWLYMGVDPGTPRAAELVDMISMGTIPYWKNSSPTFDKLMRLPLDLGSSFATAIVEKNGLEALDEVILRPPRSTEQILHIDRYLNGDEPKVLTPLEPELGRDWALQATDTLGEAMIALTMASWGLEPSSSQVAENWGGDLLQIWDTEDGAQLAVWQIKWDTSSATSVFYGHLMEVLPRALLRGLIIDTTPSSNLPRGRWWAGRQGAIFLYRQVNLIVLIWGSDESAVENAAVVLN